MAMCQSVSWNYMRRKWNSATHPFGRSCNFFLDKDNLWKYTLVLGLGHVTWTTRGSQHKRKPVYNIRKKAVHVTVIRDQRGTPSGCWEMEFKHPAVSHASLITSNYHWRLRRLLGHGCIVIVWQMCSVLWWLGAITDCKVAVWKGECLPSHIHCIIMQDWLNWPSSSIPKS